MESSTGSHPDQRSDHSIYRGTLIVNARTGQITHYVQGVTAQSTTEGKCAQHQVQDATDVIKGVIIVHSAFQGKPLPVLVK